MDKDTSSRSRLTLELEENGIVRRAVFPNQVRVTRQKVGFATLSDFHNRVGLTYTRMLKIERGEIFPTSAELKVIAECLNVPVGELLIDETKASFDREAWAREHIEAKLENRGGNIEAMRLGAAVRVKRQALGRSTTNMKEFGLPAATVSRIENADRPIERWDATVQRGIAKVLGARNARRSMQIVNVMYERGELDEMLSTLFSPASIEERNRKRLRALLAELPDTVAADMLDSIGGTEVELRHGADNLLTVSTSILADCGVFKLAPSNRTIRVPAGAGRAAFAIEMAEAVLGPGLPKGSVIVADPHQNPVAGDLVVIREEAQREAVVLSTAAGDEGLIGFSLMSDEPMKLNLLPVGQVLAKVVVVVF